MHYYYNSHLGQPLKLFDKAGKITWAARSQAFGQTTVFVNETENNLRFPGQYEDGETGLYYNFHRYYDPATGRYLRSDPIGLRGGYNSYSYVTQSPISKMDPIGLASLDWLWAGIYRLTGWEPTNTQVTAGAAIGDGLTFGLTKLWRDKADIGGGVDPCSRLYKTISLTAGFFNPAGAGGRLAYVVSAARIPGKFPIASPVTAAAAVEMRNNLNNWWRGPLAGVLRNWRAKSYEGLILAGRDFAYIISRSGVTNSGWTTGIVLVSAAANAARVY